MAHYTTFDELNGKTLKGGDTVVIAGIFHAVCGSYLATDEYSNSAAFHKLKVSETVVSKVYGYPPEVGSWLASKYEDFEALTRMVLVLKGFEEGAHHVDVEIEGKWVSIFHSKMIPLNDDYHVCFEDGKILASNGKSETPASIAKVLKEGDGELFGHSASVTVCGKYYRIGCQRVETKILQKLAKLK